MATALAVHGQSERLIFDLWAMWAAGYSCLASRHGDDLRIRPRPSPGAGKYPLDAGHFDEAFAPTGTPRPPYADVLGALARQDLVVLRERVQIRRGRNRALSFGRGRRSRSTRCRG